MTYTDKNAVYALNSYVWKLIEANLGWNVSDYAGARPIIPSAQQPEFMEQGKPFLIYGSNNKPVEHLYAMRCEAVSYTIYSESSTEANRVVNLLVDAFEGQDETAARVNEHLTAEAKNRGIAFGSIGYKMSNHAGPATDEGGYSAAFILLEMDYTVQNNTVQLDGFTYP